MLFFQPIKYSLSHIKLFLIFLFLLQRTSEDSSLSNQLVASTPHLPKKCNANTPSSIFLDVLLNNSHFKSKDDAKIGSYIPWQLATKKRIEGNAAYSSSIAKHYLIWLNVTSQSFFHDAENLLREEEERYIVRMSKLEDAPFKELNDLLPPFISKDEISDLEQKLTQVLEYRFRIEIAIFASQLNYINCGEHAAIAFVETLIESEKGYWPANTPLNIHYISLGNTEDCIGHRFLVRGSTTLPSKQQIIHDQKAVARILDEMDGEIIDHWNNPQAGGLRLSTTEAKRTFGMYSSEVSQVWDCMEIIGYHAQNMHSQIKDMHISEEVKDFFLKYAGPTLAEIENLLNSDNHNRIQCT